MVMMVEPEWGALTGDEPLTRVEVEEKAQSLLTRMTLKEKIGQMSGDIPFLPGALAMAHAYNTEPIPAGENLRLGLPGIRFSDGPRGVVMYHSTCFPVSMARGASWDIELEERIGDAIGVEARAQGANIFGGVCINLLRHPAWGRAQETYSEDSHLLGEMGVLTIGLLRPAPGRVAEQVDAHSPEEVGTLDTRFHADGIPDALLQANIPGCAARHRDREAS